MDRKHSLELISQKLEHLMYVSFFCFPPKGETMSLNFSSNSAELCWLGEWLTQ
jgi:hypothetical protein